MINGLTQALNTACSICVFRAVELQSKQAVIAVNAPSVKLQHDPSVTKQQLPHARAVYDLGVMQAGRWYVLSDIVSQSRKELLYQMLLVLVLQRKQIILERLQPSGAEQAKQCGGPTKKEVSLPSTSAPPSSSASTLDWAP